MATARSFEKLEIWKSARTLVKRVYVATQANAFSKDFGLRDQLRRAAISIVSNIAEGFERGGNPEFIRFLNIAKGSAGEVRAQLYLALDLEYLAPSQFKNLEEQVTAISRQISSLTAYLQNYRGPRTKTPGSRSKASSDQRFNFKPLTFNHPVWITSQN